MIHYTFSLSIILYLLDTQNRNIYPKYLEVNIGETVKFSCYGDLPFWVFNRNYPLLHDIKIEKKSIIIEDVQLKHTGSYYCTAFMMDYKKLAKLKLQTFLIATATLKVLGKYTS